MIAPSTAEEKICKKNDVKAKSLLLMALPNEHQLTFDQYVDAQSMFAAIKARFGGNEATKKTQKALLKQQYENFNASSSESLDSIFNMLQKLVSRLAILGVVTPPEDLNVKFLRSLPSKWDTHVVVWMNKPDFDTMGLDDLYNNFKIIEQKVKRSAGANNDDKNLAFLTTSGASSTKNINTVNPEVSTGTTKVNTTNTEVSTTSFSDATVYAFLSTQPQGSQLVHEDLEQLHEDDFCREKGIKREYSVARTPQQNGVAERKNRTLIKAAKTMLGDSKLPTTFWAEAVSTACYIQNRVLIVKPHNKTPYELFRGFKPAIGFIKPFGCHVTILNTLDNLGKFDDRVMKRKGPKWLFDLDSLTQSMNYVPVVAGKYSNDFADASYFGDASPKIVDDAQIEDKDELHDEDDATEESHDGSILKENGTADQQLNTARPDMNTGSREVSTALPEVNTATPEDLVGPSPASEDSHMEVQEIDIGETFLKSL
ncbi:ribonuclease H-like domain-containing protein [Tanacetum coccineum]|uniref:Ribonuclease H-like domain-containing protein n=1 Tax=Tanacetum coccineum TaxID=301880 RepID=A0ABQ5E856_9ASTR